MLISHTHKFIYTKTTKTASTSVEAYFERFCMRPGEWEPKHLRDAYESEIGVIGYRGYHPEGKKWINHMPARMIRDAVGADVWGGYFKFCVIRNPWDKAISAFEHLGKTHQLPPGLEGDEFRAHYADHDDEQLRFLHWLKTVGSSVDRGAYLIDGQLCMDDMIRYENLQDDMRRVCAKLSLAWEPSFLPEYKTEYRRSEATVKRLYMSPAKDLIAQAFAFEIDAFSYRFDA